MQKRKLSLFILLLSRTARSMSAGMIAIGFPYLVLQTLHYSPLHLGTIFAIGTLATAIFGFIFGMTTDLWGKKKTLVLVSIMLPISCVLLLFSQSLPMMYLAAAIGGFSATGSLAGGGIGGAAQPIQNTILADLTTPEERTFYFSLFPFINGIGASIGALSARFFDAHLIFLIAALLSFAGTIVVLFLSTHEVKGKLLKLEGKITIGKFTLTGLLNGFSQGLITPFLIPFFILIYHISERDMSFFTFVSGAIGACVLLMAPLIDKKLGFVKSITITRGIAVILLLLLPLVHFLPLALLIYFITPALRVISVPIQQKAITTLVNDNERGRALGVNQVVRLGGSSLAIALSGSLFAGPFIAVPFYLYAGVMGVNIYLYNRFFRK